MISGSEKGARRGALSPNPLEFVVLFVAVFAVRRIRRAVLLILFVAVFAVRRIRRAVLLAVLTVLAGFVLLVLIVLVVVLIIILRHICFLLIL